jgi:SAM-dependent methyltransferase
MSTLRKGVAAPARGNRARQPGRDDQAAGNGGLSSGHPKPQVQVPRLKPIHPFPARMAPEIAFSQIEPLPAGSLILDPMVGSGTTVRMATELGHRALGFDLDPLAVLMSRVWTTPVSHGALVEAAGELVEAARALGEVELPWMDEDPRTTEFVNFWFADKQRHHLRKIAYLLQPMQGPLADALRVALSRIIITKKGGASLAWDTSHSRPHRVADDNDFDVYEGFVRSAAYLARLLEKQPPRGGATIRPGDARALDAVEDGLVDVVITSPPYLNAISYLRGHRLSLVWLGYGAGEGFGLGGAEEPDDPFAREALERMLREMGEVERMPPAEQRVIRRYAVDLQLMLRETVRVLRPGGRAVYVIGDSCLRGRQVRNSAALKLAALEAGLGLVHDYRREIPPNRRYLPPPTRIGGSLEKRMRWEHVLVFEKKYLRVLPHSSTPAILRSTRLRIRLCTSRMRLTRATRPQ